MVLSLSKNVSQQGSLSEEGLENKVNEFAPTSSLTFSENRKPAPRLDVRSILFPLLRSALNHHTHTWRAQLGESVPVLRSPSEEERSSFCRVSIFFIVTSRSTSYTKLIVDGEAEFHLAGQLILCFVLVANSLHNLGMGQTVIDKLLPFCKMKTTTV